MKRAFVTIVISLLTYFSSEWLYAQNDDFELRYDAEANIISGGGDFSPFWLSANRQGLVSLSPNNGYLRMGIHKDMEVRNRFSYGFGVDLVGAYEQSAPFYVQQAYVDLKYRSLGVTIGSKEQTSLLEHPELSSGSMVWSGNARPVPQLSVGIPRFTDVPGTNGWMQVKGELSYGFSTDANYQRDRYKKPFSYARHILFHRKNLIFRFEKDAPFFGLVGIDMAAHFGGDVYYSDGSVVHCPTDLESFFKVFVPMSGGSNSTWSDQVNVLGNHVGSYLMEFGYKQDDWRISIYKEHYFDDHSGMIFKNWQDGLWGFEWTRYNRSWLTGFVFECMNSTDQSGPILWNKNETIPIQVSGADDYYNNIYGWAHWGMTQGTPFITSPDYNADGYMSVRNSRVRAFHVGVKGCITEELDYRFLSSYSRNWGTLYLPFLNVKNNYSGLLEVRYAPAKYPGFSFGTAVGVDAGSLLGDNWGIQLSVRKSGLLFRKKR